VRGSWLRSLAAGVDPTLAQAPRVAGRDELEALLRRRAWFSVVDELSHRSPLSPSGRDHVLTIFDADGTMLACHGDSWVQARLGEINFAPGGSWAESAVGTNGPGTALAIGRPIEVVGAEHFCRAWQPWHCAAVPLRDPASGRLLGAIDVSGPAAHSHPHTLELVRALGIAIERTWWAESLERRGELMRAFVAAAGRCPGERLAVVDGNGLVVAATLGAQVEWREGAVVAGLVDYGVLDEALLLRLGAASAQPIGHRELTIGWIVRLGSAPSLPLHPSRPSRPVSTASPRTTRYAFADLIGHSAPLAAVRRVAETAAGNDLPVLLIGESGVGKEVVAQAIHAASARAERPFVAVNCAALPPELLESELFGYVAGAFTGARRDGAAGRFEAAHGGTVFLDEIGELSHSAQAALLRVLQEGEVTRVGATTPRRIDVRVIAATQQGPGEAVKQGRLRKDLYYRLAVLPCELPPLRARRQDVPLLVERFLDDAAVELGAARPRIDGEALALLARYDWPGNVRELKNLMRRLVATTIGTIGRAALPAELLAAIRDGDGDDDRGGDGGRERLLAALASARTISDAARALGIGRSTLYRQMTRYGLELGRMFGPRVRQ
jgi:transcriptional regulator of acetoin/glycerol metabolism